MPKIFFTDLQSRIEKFNLRGLGAKVVRKYLLIGGSVVVLVLSIFLTAKLTQRPTTPETTQAESCSPVSGHLSFLAVARPDCPTGWGCTPAYQCTSPFYEVHPDQNTESFLSHYSCTGSYVCCRTVSQTPVPTPTLIPTPIPTLTVTATPTLTPTPTGTVASTPTPTLSPTPTPTAANQPPDCWRMVVSSSRPQLNETINVSVEASDPDGSVTGVEFFYIEKDGGFDPCVRSQWKRFYAGPQLMSSLQIDPTDPTNPFLEGRTYWLAANIFDNESIFGVTGDRGMCGGNQGCRAFGGSCDCSHFNHCTDCQSQITIATTLPNVVSLLSHPSVASSQIQIGDSVTFTCTGADVDGDIGRIYFRLLKDGQVLVGDQRVAPQSLEVSDACGAHFAGVWSYTFSGPGSYDVYCRVCSSSGCTDYSQ